MLLGTLDLNVFVLATSRTLKVLRYIDVRCKTRLYQPFTKNDHMLVETDIAFRFRDTSKPKWHWYKCHQMSNLYSMLCISYI